MAAETAPAAAAAPASSNTRPQMPDRNVFKAELAKAEQAHKVVRDRLNAIKAKIDLASPNKDQQSPVQKRRQELNAQANEIRQKQAGDKNNRSSKLDQIKRLDEQVRSRIAEQKAAKAKIPYKSLEDVDRQIAHLDSQVNSGAMKLVDERKALADISSLRKLRKNFGQFDESQKHIEELRAKIKDIKDGMNDPEQKAISEQYNKIKAELDQIKAEQNVAYKGLSDLRDERSKLYAEQQQAFSVIRKLKDDFDSQRTAAQNFEREAREKARERRDAEYKRYQLEQKKAQAERLLNDASDPAYLEEIRRANNLLYFLDPSQKPTEKAPLLAASGLTAQAQRTVDGSDLKGTALVKKADREDEYLPATKKGKKGKKSAGGCGVGATTKGYSCPPSVVEDCSFIGIDPPMSADEVPAVVEKVKAKLDGWKADQAAQTQKNIEAAKKRIEELDKADSEGANGDKTEKVSEELIKASISEKQDAQTE